MKIKYWLSALILLNVLIFAGCSQTTTPTTSNPVTTSTSKSDVPTINVADAFNLIQQNTSNPNFVILDVRTEDEFNTGYIAGATNIDYHAADFQTNVGKLDRNKQYLVYCASGIRGASATQIMLNLGFKQVQNIAGGIAVWIQAGYPVTTPTITPTSIPTTTSPTITTTPLSNGLQLSLSINTARLTAGETLQIDVSEYNILTTYNNVAAAINRGVNGLTIGACPDINVLPFGVAVFQGHYDAQNISQGTPLALFEAVPCVQLIRLITGYDFLPDSNDAAIMPGGDLTSPTPMSATETVKGTYSKGIQLTPLTSGMYTVVAGDEWGTLEFLYINVE